MAEPVEELSDSSQLSLSCSFSSIEHKNDEGKHSQADDTDEEESTTEDVTGTVEPYLYEPEVSDYEGPFTSDSSDEEDGDDSSDEGRVGSTDW